jgi:transposase
MPYGRATPIVLSGPERAELEGLARRRNAPQGLALRARIVLRCAEGLTNQAVAGEVRVCAHTVGEWRERFAAARLAGLSDEPRSGAPRRIGDEAVAALVARTLETMPAGATHRSRRSMAEAAGLSAATVGRVWRAFGLRPHRSETFELSTDPEFVEKVRDIVGLYLAPPERALVPCVDEKAGVRALDRAQPLLPLRPGQAERRTHDYARHGTTSLFAALDIRTGTVIGRCSRRHRAAEFRRFLDAVEAAVPADLDVHVVMDNAGIHETALIRGWFAARPRWHVHRTPTSASWLNRVERFFALLTEKALRRGVHRSVAELEASIEASIAATNADPKPFRWTKSADDILAAVQRFCSRTLAVHEAQL